MQPQGTSAHKYTLLENQSSTIPDTTTNGKRVKNRFYGCSGCIPNAIDAVQSTFNYPKHPMNYKNDMDTVFFILLCEGLKWRQTLYCVY